jgi:hypothetical protein
VICDEIADYCSELLKIVACFGDTPFGEDFKKGRLLKK